MLYLIIIALVGFKVYSIFFKKYKLKTGIEIYMGLPGAGKTTFAAYIAKKHLKNGYKVWSNMPIDGCIKIDLKNDLMKYDISEGLVLIDEAGIEYDSRQHKAFPKEAVEFFKLHRHFKLRVCCFSQYWDDIDKKIRTITNEIYVVKKSILPKFIVAKSIRSWIGVNKDTYQIEQQYDWACPLPVPIWGVQRIFSPVLWRMFDSWDRPKLPEKQWEYYKFNRQERPGRIKRIREILIAKLSFLKEQILQRVTLMYKNLNKNQCN